MAHSVTEWLTALQQVMPRGKAWPRDNDADLNRFLRALAERLTRVEYDALASCMWRCDRKPRSSSCRSGSNIWRCRNAELPPPQRKPAAGRGGEIPPQRRAGNLAD